MNIVAAEKTYTLTLEKDFSFVPGLLARENSFVVVDERVYGLYPSLFSGIQKERLYLLRAEENCKTVDTALGIVERMTNMPGKRNAWLISFGGGIVQDVTGFVASILYRGVHWAFVPTTLLAGCDSCIGSKTSLNFHGYKNLLGTFYPPDEVYDCPAFFQTLTEADYLSGLGEVVKFNIMYGEEGLAYLEAGLPDLLARKEDVVRAFTQRSLSFKKPFVEEDEFDRGRRVLLNFGHTFGHAIETASQYRVPHGTGVAMGTLMANRIAMGRGLIREEALLRMEKLLLAVIPRGDENLGFSPGLLVDATRKDKKNTGRALTAVLLAGDGQLKVVHDLREEEITSAFDLLKAALSKKGRTGEGK